MSGAEGALPPIGICRRPRRDAEGLEPVRQNEQALTDHRQQCRGK